MTFAAAIRAFEEKALLRANQSITEAIVTLTNDVISFSPRKEIGAAYSRGSLINNWRISTGSPDMTFDGMTDDKGTMSSIRAKQFAKTFHFLKQDNTVFISNSATWSFRANYIGWPIGPGTNGWVWTNGVKAYGFVGKGINNLKGKYM